MADFEIVDAKDIPRKARGGRPTGPYVRMVEALIAAGPGKALKMPLAGKNPGTATSRIHSIAKRKGLRVMCRRDADALYAELLGWPAPPNMLPPNTPVKITLPYEGQAITSFPRNGELTLHDGTKHSGI